MSRTGKEALTGGPGTAGEARSGQRTLVPPMRPFSQVLLSPSSPLDTSHPASLQPTPHPPVPRPLPLPGHSGKQRAAANMTDTYNIGKF